MPQFGFLEDGVIVALPELEDMGSVNAGLSCGITRMIALGGPMTEDVLSSHLKAPTSMIREALRYMEDDGRIVTMMVDGKRTTFLTDRKLWRDRLKKSSEEFARTVSGNSTDLRTDDPPESDCI